MFLPSGRPIVYCDARVGAAGDLSYQGHRSREHIYGGKLAENAIQAACRDPMAEAAADANDAGLNPVLTVHDEIVCEVPNNAGSEAYDVLQQLMIDALKRMPGFPAGAEGFVGERYRK
jgi:DNA polymerase